jgi:hypothetical protein
MIRMEVSPFQTAGGDGVRWCRSPPWTHHQRALAITPLSVQFD